jgi:hypothetical protein
MIKLVLAASIALACAGCSTSSWKAAQWEQDDDATCKRAGGDYHACRERQMRYREAVLGNNVSVTARQR